MSDYVRNKQVLYPIDKYDSVLCNKYNVEKAYDISWKVPELEPLFEENNDGYFEITVMSDKNYNVNYYLAYTLFSSYGKECGDFGRSRFLTQNEQDKYKKIFEQIIPEIDKNKLKYCDYCWYNCSEPDDYYVCDDKFDKEI